MQINYFEMDANDQTQYSNRINNFCSSFNIPTILNRSGVRKSKGFAAKDIFFTLLSLPFLGINLFHGVVQNDKAPYNKDVVYDFLKNEKFNWRKVVLSLVVKIVNLFRDLTNQNREKVLIIDDSCLKRPRSKMVELLARLFDHSEGKYYKGYKLLSICWSDGVSTLPLDFALLSSTNSKNRLQEITKDIDKRSSGYKRRVEALSKSTELLEPMVKRTLNHGIPADYALMDSWFGMPKIIKDLRQHINVICMVKRTPTILYKFRGKWTTLDGIYRQIKKRPGRAKILGNALVEMKYGGEAKLVFVRNRDNSDWLAILTTDINLPDEEVVRIYGKRWDIEVFFKMCKQHLGLEKGVQTRDFDSQIAHTSIVMIRFMFLALEQRRQDDPRTFGSMFRACCEEMRDLDFMAALKRILDLAVDRLRSSGEYAEQTYSSMIAEVFGAAIDFFGLNKQECQRSQAVT
jgi:hypothetical protein